ncbi:MAG: MGMT family protein [Candidatus Doudnabacteria bacterium]|nr:MGMT family protein [Candidatus Doudnabacteria bacterium]
MKINWSKYTDFQTRVFKTILKIPKGRVLTYAEVARRIGKPRAARAVGQALSKNMDAPFIPCHRVVASNGLGGYSAQGGLKSKIKLLRKEGYL